MQIKQLHGILGNIDAESTFSPNLEEKGGQGYGLVQWTPVSVLQSHCNILGLSPYTSGDVQIDVIINEILGSPTSVNEWYTTSGFISNYYNSGATQDMIGITGRDFLDNKMNWESDKLAIMFMAGYERPSYDPSVNHFDYRKERALFWYKFMGGVPPTPTPQIKFKKMNINILLNIKKKRKKFIDIR